jgi:hypothetical protein
MKFLGKLFISLLVTIVLLAGIAISGYYYVKSSYGIDIIKTVNELVTLNEPVDEATLCPNAFSDSDMVDVQTIVNESVEDFITYTVEHGYSVNFNDLPDEMKYIIRLTDKQVGALAQTVVKQEIGGKIDFGGKKVDVALKQMQFSAITETSALLNTVLSVDMTPFKEDMPEEFPYTYLKQYVPDALYVSSTVKVEKGSTPFSYSIVHDSLAINNLSKEDTEDFFRTLDIVLSVGAAETWNVQVGTAITNALIGNESNNGLAYALRGIGATDYAFSQEGEIAYFSVLR